MLRKAVALFLAAMMSLSFAACGTKENKTSKSSKGTSGSASSEPVKFPLSKPVKMTMLAIPNSDVKLDDTLAMKEMEKRTNVQWKIQSVSGADLVEKRNLLLNSNQYPDTFMKSYLDEGTLNKHGSQGTFVKLNDLIQKDAPNLTKVLAERPDVRQAITLADGFIYAFPEIDSLTVGSNPLFINQKWLDALGLKAPTNTDEFYEVLSKFKTGDPNGNGKADEIPLICTTGTSINGLYPYLGITNYGHLTLVDGKPQYIETTDQFKEFLKFCKKLYQEELLAKDAFTMDLDQQKAIGASGDTLGCFFEAGAFLTVGRDRDKDFPALMPFEKDVYPIGTGTVGGTFAITDKCKYPDIAVAWADQWYSEEGGRLAWMGVEGETYKINEDGSWDWILGKYGDLGTLRANASIQGSAQHPSVQPEIWMKNVSDKNELKVNKERSKIVEVGAKSFPTLHYSDADNKKVANITADIDPYVSQYIAEIVTGRQELDESWDTYIDTLQKMGLDELMTIYIKVYEDAVSQ